MNSGRDARSVTALINKQKMNDDNGIILSDGKIPQHVAIIMDGNGRWAKSRNQARTDGHVKGVDAVRTVIRESGKLGIKYLTLYAFSTENWNRPQAEVDALMDLIVVSMHRELPEMLENGVRMRVIGDMFRLPEKSRVTLQECIEATANGTGLTLTVALSYSSRWEITEAVRAIAREVESGAIKADDITDATVCRHLATSDIPDPDLLIRTGGDIRVSNYLLWQIAYAELYFTPTLWPDFDGDSLRAAIAEYQHRERRYGRISEQLVDGMNPES